MTLEIVAAALGLVAALKKNKQVSGVGEIEKHYPDLPQYVLDELNRKDYSISDFYGALQKMDRRREPLALADRDLYDAINSACEDYADDLDSGYDAEIFLESYETEDVFMAVLDIMQTQRIRGVGYAAAGKPYWAGIPKIQFIYHGDWGDPELYYRGKYYNAMEIEYDLYQIYAGEKSPLNFSEWLRENQERIKYSLQYEYTPVSGVGTNINILNAPLFIVNKEEQGKRIYVVSLWPGNGYFVYNIGAYADSEEEALEYVVAYLDKKNDSRFFVDEEVYELESNGADEDEIDEFAIYVDPTMVGGKRPHYIRTENLGIERV